MPYAQSANARIYFETKGSPEAPALLLHRGLARSMQYWLGLDDELARSFHVVTMDHRGVGRSDAPMSGYTTKKMADDVAAVLDAAELDRAHFFGMSLGGMVAQWFALRHPDRLHNLILGATTAGGTSAHGIPVRARWGLARCAALPLDESVARTARFTLASGHSHVVPRWTAIARSEPTNNFGIAGQALSAMLHSAAHRLADIEHRTLVLTGDQDALIPFENSLTIARLLPNATLKILDGAGHDFAAEQPGPTLATIREFLHSENSAANGQP